MDNLYNKAAKGLSILFLIRILSRVVDFLLNILVIRDLDPEVFGKMSAKYLSKILQL